MMNFGFKFTANNELILIDMDTAEILAEGASACADWVNAYEGNCTYVIVE